YYCVSLYHTCLHLALHSFPTRRSSDLTRPRCGSTSPWPPTGETTRRPSPRRRSGSPRLSVTGSGRSRLKITAGSPPGHPGSTSRSEEHTSELQSRENLVCRLLLGKKKR